MDLVARGPFVPKAQTLLRMVLAIFSEVKRLVPLGRFSTRSMHENSGVGDLPRRPAGPGQQHRRFRVVTVSFHRSCHPNSRVTIGTLQSTTPPSAFPTTRPRAG